MQNKFDDVNFAGFSVNVCNDTVIKCVNQSESDTIPQEKRIYNMFNSLAIYRWSNGSCTRIAGEFFNPDNFLVKNGLNFEYKTTGDYCRTLGDTSYNYTTTFKFSDTKGNTDSVDYYGLFKPDRDLKDSCDETLKIQLNFEKHTDHLLIQKFFNDYYIATGIIFLIVGVYLLFFAKYKKITKFTISTIFGQIFAFTLGVGMIGTKIRDMHWAFFAAGIAIGGAVGYFCLGGNRLYRVILALTAGFIFGLIIFDVLFTHLVSRFSQVFLIDTLIIFISLSILIICLQHSFHYFYDSVVGSYILVRGFCTLIQKAGKYARYRELQTLLYTIGYYEIELAKEFYKDKWPIYYMYTIIMFVVMGGSIVFDYFKNYKKDEEDEAEIEKENQKKLMKGRTTSYGDDGELD